MWFASIWIFTLRLPWTLGADFFLRHLLDADPASNTLGWRWVAGIQTPGKTYLARADNIARYTGDRFRPTGLASTAPPIRIENPPPARRMPELRPPVTDGPILLLLHGDDLAGFDLLPSGLLPDAVIVAAGGHPEHVWPFGPKARDFVARLAEDSANDLARRFPTIGDRSVEVLHTLDADRIRECCASIGSRCVLTPEAPAGPIADGLECLASELAESSVELHPLRRRWDALAWPHATHGFFRFREAIPELIAALHTPSRSDGFAGT